MYQHTMPLVTCVARVVEMPLASGRADLSPKVGDRPEKNNAQCWPMSGKFGCIHCKKTTPPHWHGHTEIVRTWLRDARRTALHRPAEFGRGQCSPKLAKLECMRRLTLQASRLHTPLKAALVWSTCQTFGRPPLLVWSETPTIGSTSKRHKLSDPGCGRTGSISSKLAHACKVFRRLSDFDGHITSPSARRPHRPPRRSQ